MRSRLGAVAAVLILAALGGAARVAAAPSEDRILPVEQYTSEKARTLALTYAPVLRELNAKVYHCMPWVEVQKQSIGFFRPKQAPQDDRYLSIRLYIEQDMSDQFTRLSVEQRASAMFSRYAGPMLRRMARPALMADSALDGFTVILEWLKQVPKAVMERPVHETIAAFFQKAVVADFLGGRITVPVLPDHARVLGWDGERPLGPLQLTAWDDDFVSTYKIKNYVLEAGAKCP